MEYIFLYLPEGPGHSFAAPEGKGLETDHQQQMLIADSMAKGWLVDC